MPHSTAHSHTQQFNACAALGVQHTIWEQDTCDWYCLLHGRKVVSASRRHQVIPAGTRRNNNVGSTLKWRLTGILPKIFEEKLKIMQEADDNFYTENLFSTTHSEFLLYPTESYTFLPHGVPIGALRSWPESTHTHIAICTHTSFKEPFWLPEQTWSTAPWTPLTLYTLAICPHFISLLLLPNNKLSGPSHHHLTGRTNKLDRPFTHGILEVNSVRRVQLILS